MTLEGPGDLWTATGRRASRGPVTATRRLRGRERQVPVTKKGGASRRAHQPSVSTWSSRSTKKSALSTVMHSGGFTFSTFEWSPVACSMTPSSRSRSQIAVASRGRRLAGHRIADQLDALIEARGRGRTRSADAGRPARRAAAQVSADPARVALQVLVADRVQHGDPDRRGHRAAADRGEERSLRRRTRSAISRRVTTNPIGWPLPAALAMVITSGTTPCSSNPQNASPVRP